MSRYHDQMAESLAARPEFMVTLEVAVPMWQHRWRGRPVDQQLARARVVAHIVTTYGDRILYHSKGGRTRRIPAQEPDGGWQTCGYTHAPPDTVLRNPSTGEVFNALAEGVALLSLTAPGGVNLWGRHWHDGCPATAPWPDTCVDLTEAV